MAERKGNTIEEKSFDGIVYRLSDGSISSVCIDFDDSRMRDYNWRMTENLCEIDTSLLRRAGTTEEFTEFRYIIRTYIGDEGIGIEAYVVPIQVHENPLQNPSG